MYWQTLRLYEKVLGKDHLDTLTSIINVAIMLLKTGKYKEAEQIYWQTL